MTNFLMLIGAGLFSKAVGAFQENAFNKLLGADVDDAGGDGPGSYPVKGNVWHLDCCNPDSKFDGEGWTIFGAIFGWTNNATCESITHLLFKDILISRSGNHTVIRVLLARGYRGFGLCQV